MPSARKFVNRRAAGYHINRINQVVELDKAASYLLARNYSGRTSPTAISQSLIQMDCVAVAVVNNEWLIASNSRKLGDDDAIMLAHELGMDITYALVKRGSGYMHAEMQILEELAESKYQSANVFIGVSKPCCLQCAQSLDQAGSKYTSWHNTSVANWEKPDLS
ncbi:OTT_1508-like deaminase [Pseudomonas syringae]|jgi:hypothetical protein|uniref:Uncharacterized protein n=1 Tax=Pseudomonas syringae pv. apii TaxID=81036 RepID=A0A3M3S0E3_9PSED|nr:MULTISPECIES: nucleic acid/nucleotide deaminase domain-containing protein [Pseudomonas syringae group]POD80994.1 hypothetical protein BKM17_03415 [Pseudomonas syringae group genomosp. 3]RMN44226.1 hypothetical protein ALQ58_02639 [Pseudomonas syringae pv. apii]RMN50351.1 hypothetical protein ALQ59_00845 [Pseudomonas syringae pv. apii]RMO02170.1 hypothetical protein ALQ49_01617 [Pseudomonas syringae pv. apii]SDZ12147.1 OTT_1508-like deaminase [Pseudomonas syringae]